MKAEKLRVREMAKALEEDKKREAAEKRARREENEKRRDENARKNEVVQQVKNYSQLPFLSILAASRPSKFA